MLGGVATLGASLLLAQSIEVKPASEPVYQTVVTARPPSPDGGFRLAGREAASLPGAAGDPGRALENAPGVGRLAPGADGLVLWGATPQESRVLLDGVEIPALFHFGGWRSLVPAESIRSAEVSPGAFSADYGRAVGGLVKLESVSPSSESRHAWLAADPLDVSLGASGPLSPRVGFFAAGRFGYLDHLSGLLASRESRTLMPLPAYRDAIGSATVDLGVGRSLTVEVLGSHDRRDLELDLTSPIDILAEARTRDFARAMLRYREIEGHEVTSALAFVGQDRAALDQQLGLVPVAQHSGDIMVGARLSHAIGLEKHWLEGGIDGLVGIWQLSRTGSLTNPPREGDLTVFGAPLGSAVASDAWHPILANIAPYAMAELRWGRLELRPGLRIDGELVSGDRVLPPTGLTPRVGFSRTYWSPEPRLAMTVTTTHWLDLGLAGGIHHQPPDAADLSAVFGSPSLGPSRALDGVVSAIGRRGVWRVESAGFVRRLDNLAVRNPDSQAGLAQALVAAGQGRSYGIQFLIRAECRSSGICAHLAYTLSRSERRGPGATPWRLLDFDQTHVLTAALGYRGRKWYGGARARYATGMPRTPVVGSFFDGSAGEYRPILGEVNSSRLPSFAELDVRVEREWRWPWATVALSAEIVNATNRTNPEEIVYSGEYANHAYIRGLPLLPLVGLRLEI